MAITHILKSNSGKQIVGGLLGMGVAGMLYLAVDQASYLNMKGLLVSTNTVSDTSGQVAVNSDNVNPDTMQRLAARAQQVAAQLEESQTESSSSAAPAPDTPINQRAADRGAQRFYASSTAAAMASAPTYDVNPNHVMSEQERLAIRTARVSYDPSVDAQRPFYGTTSVFMPSVSAQNVAEVSAAAPVTVVDPSLHSGAPMEPHADSLPSSGFGLQSLAMLALLLAAARYRKTLSHRFVAVWHRAQ